jgi:RHS repeat-associated protein
VNSAAGYEYYVRGPGGELLASFVDGETPSPRYHHFDQLGNMVLLTNGSGSRLGKTYDAWGNRVDGGASTTSPYQYVGELGYYTHTNTQGPTLDDLLQLGVRFYDPEIGRFTQRDAAEQGLNWYEYAAGRPLFFVDPSGLLIWECHYGPKITMPGISNRELVSRHKNRYKHQVGSEEAAFGGCYCLWVWNSELIEWYKTVSRWQMFKRCTYWTGCRWMTAERNITGEDTAVTKQVTQLGSDRPRRVFSDTGVWDTYNQCRCPGVTR